MNKRKNIKGNYCALYAKKKKKKKKKYQLLLLIYLQIVFFNLYSIKFQYQLIYKVLY